MSQINRIIGIGSPHGDDQIAWRFAERLQERRCVDASVITLRTPLQLCDHLAGCDRLLIVDACRGSGRPGTVTRLVWPDERIKTRHSHSSHGFSVGSTLELAEKLGQLPATIILFGVEVEQSSPGAAISDALERVFEKLEQCVLLELNQATAIRRF